MVETDLYKTTHCLDVQSAAISNRILQLYEKKKLFQHQWAKMKYLHGNIMEISIQIKYLLTSQPCCSKEIFLVCFKWDMHYSYFIHTIKSKPRVGYIYIINNLMILSKKNKTTICEVGKQKMHCSSSLKPMSSWSHWKTERRTCQRENQT